jgi:RsiW-degrading membrane proteinase PrsW (M82 family)
MAFEDFVGYFIIMAVFIVGFLPLLADFVTQAQSVAEPKTAMVLGFLIPFILIVMVVAFFMRLKGDEPMGSW